MVGKFLAVDFVLVILDLITEKGKSGRNQVRRLIII
jgi:hypothetical protein